MNMLVCSNSGSILQSYPNADFDTAFSTDFGTPSTVPTGYGCFTAPGSADTTIEFMY